MHKQAEKPCACKHKQAKTSCKCRGVQMGPMQQACSCKKVAKAKQPARQVAAKQTPVKTAETKAAEQSAALKSVGTTRTKGNKVSLQYKEPIRFGHNSDVIENVSKADISTTAAVLRKYPDNKVIVKGYTDSLGDPAYNIDLSQRRAQAVANELIKQGVKAENITAIGYGASNPVATNSTVEGRRQNRRVELEIETK